MTHGRPTLTQAVDSKALRRCATAAMVGENLSWTKPQAAQEIVGRADAPQITRQKHVLREQPGLR
jgi:hypothetical protein